MIDAGTGQVLYQQNANSKYPIASLTKILTISGYHERYPQPKIKLGSKKSK